MDVSRLLAPQGVKVLSDVSSKKRLLQSIADLGEHVVGVPSQRIFESLQEREGLGPTGVGNGIALPHTRLPDLPRVSGVFIRLERPIDFDAADRMPVDLVFALMAPEESGVDHLKALALVSRTLRDASLCAKLRANSDPTALYALLTEHEATKAA
jgi:PTS system nitrogen regulatory IIA component